MASQTQGGKEALAIRNRCVRSRCFIAGPLEAEAMSEKPGFVS
jgi:hypothetical protein